MGLNFSGVERLPYHFRHPPKHRSVIGSGAFGLKKTRLSSLYIAAASELIRMNKSYMSVADVMDYLGDGSKLTLSLGSTHSKLE